MDAGQKTDNHKQIQGGGEKEEHSQSRKGIFEILQGGKRRTVPCLLIPNGNGINEDASPAMSFRIPLID